MTVKQACRTCKVEYPRTLEYFPPHKQCTDGIDTICRGCRADYNRAWKERNRERYTDRRRELYAERHAAAQREKHRRRLELTPLKIRARIMRQGMLERSARLGIPFDRDEITLGYLVDLIERTPLCPCCGKEIDYGYREGKFRDRSPSIDRCVPSLGYVPSNIALICWRCNNLKRDATADELEAVARWMRSHTASPS